ncbi:MAG: ATP synthase F1 subunit epsilon [Bacteroidetes bacterium GWE2_29_8]|nr:MAG: ATP synthase F1 subunit epsilon [Bacteroidetes bacterium GWE2_29_8]OFY21875.1 MAG: ATP synthase F1 subunit epsilon [Bacteroidetes bacterium GWF2_29_10]
MLLQIITPDKTIFNGEVKLIQLPGIDGSFEILNNHAPIISALKKGIIRVKDTINKELSFEIGGGVIEIHDNKAIILAN